MKKLAAFTVAELLVVAILSLLIASAAFSVIRIFNQQYFTYERDHEISAELDDLYAWLKWDTYNAHRMSIADGNLWFEFSDKTIRYQFDENGIKRILSNTNQILRQYHVEHNYINAFIQNSPTTSGIIDKAVLTLSLFEEEFNLTVQKEYSAKETITKNGH